MELNLQEVAKIMDVDEEMLPLLPKIKFEGNMLNPWAKELPDIFKEINISKDKTVLDLPCGQGGVSVYLAKEYGVAITGYDLFEGFVDNANEYAREENVSDRCHYFVDDIRNVIKIDKEYDLLLWIAVPHTWDNYKETIENLRKCVKNSGNIVIADAYLYDSESKNVLPDYETLDETLKGVTEHGDKVIKLIDYKENLWTKNYKTDREAVVKAINDADNQLEKEALEKYLNHLNESEAFDIKHLGLYIMVLEIIK